MFVMASSCGGGRPLEVVVKLVLLVNSRLIMLLLTS